MTDAPAAYDHQELHRRIRELEAANATLANLLHTSEIATVFLDATGHVRDFTPPLTALFSITQRDIGQPLSAVRHNFTDLTSLPAVAELKLRGGSSELEVTHQDGRAFLCRITLDRGSNSRAEGAVALFIDITEQKRTRERLAAAVSELETIYDHVPVGLSLIDRQLRYVRVNEALAEINGIAAADHIGRTVGEVIPAGGQEAERLLRRVLDTGEIIGPIDLTGEVAADPGRTRVWISTFVPVRDKSDAVIGVSVSALEITRRKHAEKALHDNERLLRLALDGAQQGVFAYDVAADRATWDDRTRELFDAEDGEDGFSAARMVEMVYPDDRPAVQRELARALDPHDSGNYRIEHRIATKDGSTRWVAVHGQVEFTGSGAERRPVFASGTVREVTARKRVERALATSVERLRLALDVGGMAVWNWDLRSDEVDWSERYYAMIGYDPGETPPSYAAWRARVLPEDLPDVEARLEEARQACGEFSTAYRFRHPDGRTVAVLARGRFFGDDEGRAVRMTGILHDVTELREAQRRAEMSERRLAAVYANAPVGLGYHDRKLRWRAVNQALADITGCPIDRHIGKTVRELDEKLGDLVEPLLRHTLETGERKNDVELHEPAGLRGPHERWWLVNCDPAQDTDGEIIGVNVALQDISEMKSAEAHRELLLGELNHRVKNSLATIQAMASHTMRHSADSEDFHETFMGRLRAISAAHEILTQHERDGADLADLIATQVGPYVGEDGTRLTSNGPSVLLDPTSAHALGLVLHELATNAAKYGALSSSVGHITIDWRLIGDTEASRIEMVWTESGGPPVAVPRHKGFGSRLIEQSLSYSLGGSAELAYESKGLRATLVVPVDPGCR